MAFWHVNFYQYGNGKGELEQGWALFAFYTKSVASILRINCFKC